MPPSSAQTKKTTTAVKPRRRRGDGQWALGYREPLNKNEENKKNDDGLNVRDRIINIYSKAGFDSIDPTDLRGRFRWFGLYTQRAPGIDGGKTAVLGPEELDDRYFMMRVRIDGGQLSVAQLRAIAEISRDHGRDTADITNRQNVQYHWIRIEDVPAIWEKLESVGLSTTEACGDTPRVILGCPLAGVADDEIIDATEQIEQIHDKYIGSPLFSNLPRKYKSSIAGCSVHCVNHEINDVAFVGVRNEDGEVGYDLFVGGGLSTNPRFAERLGAFVRPDQVSDVWAGVTSVFRDYGFRRLRNRARLKYLLKEWGPEKFREVLEKEYLGHTLPDGPAPVLDEAYAATTWGYTANATESSTSVLHPRSAGSREALFCVWPRSSRHTVRTASVRPSTKSSSSSTSTRIRSPRSPPRWRTKVSRSTRGLSVVRSWRARASSSASSRSSKPRNAASTSSMTWKSVCPTSTSP